MQLRNAGLFSTEKDQLISNELIEEIGENLMDKAIKQGENGKHQQVLGYLSTLTDFPDQAFDYDKNEKAINKLMRDAFENTKIRQSLIPFLQA